MGDTRGTAVDETEVGSYFVANYPPFSVWTADAVERDALSLALSVAAGCGGAARACTCTSLFAGNAATSATSAFIPTKTPKTSKGYLDALLRELAVYADI